MSGRTDIVANLRTVMGSLGRLAESLTPEQWQVQSLCPAWTVQGVLVHVTTIEQALLGWRPGDENPFAAMPSIVAELDALPADRLVERFRSLCEQRVTELEAMTDEQFDEPSLTPVGPGTYGRFMQIREFDIWVHERDMRVPLGLEGDDGGAAAEMALDEVQGSIGYIVGKKIGLADGLGIAFDLTGPVHRRILAKVDGRATRVDELPAPDVTLTMDSLTFMLLACGRIDPSEPLADGRISLGGDVTLAEHAARHLAFTM